VPLLLVLTTIALLIPVSYSYRDTWPPNKAVVPLGLTPEIVSRGRLEPKAGIFSVAAFSIAPTVALGDVLVVEGQTVKKGDVVATLRNRDEAQAVLENAKADLTVAERRLEQVRRPYKDSTVTALEATVRAREADLALAEAQRRRGDVLYHGGVASEETRDMRVADVARGQATLEEARARLQAETEVAETDIQVAEAQLAAARAHLRSAQSEVELTEIRAPTDGVVLKIHAKAGELASRGPIMDIGDIAAPKIVAEVDERLVPRLRLGQRVRVSIRGDDREWPATISKIGSEILSQVRAPADAVTGAGDRIVEVEATFAASEELPRVAGLEMLVRIEVSPASKP
jgi:HlyD family secretion protein